ncbi:MAG TPA: LacI family DNA-binding transcriptional regulator [Flavitalea sp.]|nr:LacI family DNA-binding transcriptional regulator [Flavitalea sp.]
MFKPITIKDIAHALKISTSTVSRSLSDSYEINTATKMRVIEYAREHKYRKNPIALSLKQRRSYSIGVTVCEVANSFFSQAIDGIESVAYSKGYHVIISQSHDSYEREAANLQHLANRSVDGLLVSMSAETKDFSHILKLSEQGLPIVFFDRVIDAFDTHKVTSNNKEGTRNAIQALIDKGYKKIAHLANASHLSITRERLEGYWQALVENDLEVEERMIRYCHHGGRLQQEVEDAVYSIINMDDKPDAIFVASDRLSIGCLTALKKLSPDSTHPVVCGFSNSDILNTLQPEFMCVRQPAFEMGEVAMNMLIQLIESKKRVTKFESIVLDTELL